MNIMKDRELNLICESVELNRQWEQKVLKWKAIGFDILVGLVLAMLVWYFAK